MVALEELWGEDKAKSILRCARSTMGAYVALLLYYYGGPSDRKAPLNETVSCTCCIVIVNSVQQFVVCVISMMLLLIGSCMVTSCLSVSYTRSITEQCTTVGELRELRNCRDGINDVDFVTYMYDEVTLIIDDLCLY